MAAARRHMQVRVCRAGFPVEAGKAVMAVGAGAFAIVAADAEFLVNQEGTSVASPMPFSTRNCAVCEYMSTTPGEVFLAGSR